ncbi:hypothetical protein C489_07685 [Natrinema versiforme JCM 10478]|uniref:Uncharacterized protein n=1 Tax=Natrinema versiforme JCM 10478 TaxID=1227496 RepID=L9Y5W8_9EURY|nr:hypothetical protein C489_07685 [Natrinema versiforme JCM 10478]
MDFNDEIPNSTNPEGGIGVAPDSRYEFDDVFRVQNQGTQDIYVDITPISNLSLTNGGDVNLEFYIRDGDTRETIDGSNAELTVPVGKVRSVGVYIETADGSNYSIDSTTDSDQGSDTATIAADSTVDSGNAIDPGSP